MVLPISLLFEQNLPPFRALSAHPLPLPQPLVDKASRKIGIAEYIAAHVAEYSFWSASCMFAVGTLYICMWIKE